jgi:hypothetical protein
MFRAQYKTDLCCGCYETFLLTSVDRLVITRNNLHYNLITFQSTPIIQEFKLIKICNTRDYKNHLNNNCKLCGYLLQNVPRSLYRQIVTLGIMCSPNHLN